MSKRCVRKPKMENIPSESTSISFERKSPNFPSPPNVVLVVGQGEEMRTFKVHQEVLTNGLKQSPTLPVTDYRMEIKDCNPGAFEFILNCLYGLTADLILENLEQVLEIIVKYNLTNILEDHVAVYGVIEVKNVLEILDCALKLHCVRAIKECMSCVGCNAKTILSSAQFRNTNLQVVDKVISYTYMKVDSEVVIFNALYLWARAYCKRCNLPPSPTMFRKVLGSTIYRIRWGLIPDDVLKSIVKNSELLDIEDMKSLLLRNVNKTSSLKPELANSTPRGPYLVTRLFPDDCKSVRITTTLTSLNLHGVSYVNTYGTVSRGYVAGTISISFGKSTEQLLKISDGESKKWTLPNPKHLLPSVPYVLSVNGPCKAEDLKEEEFPTGQPVTVEVLPVSKYGHITLKAVCFEIYHEDYMKKDHFDEICSSSWEKL